MHISTRGRYALRALVDLSLQPTDAPASRQDIAARQDISADYVAQLFARLGDAGLVEGVRGPHGGYLLARDPASIRVGDVIRAVEGPIVLVHCTAEREGELCEYADRCVTHRLWCDLSDLVADFLDSVTLADLRDKSRELLPDDSAGLAGP
jgi:Rrf2 family protein